MNFVGIGMVLLLVSLLVGTAYMVGQLSSAIALVAATITVPTVVLLSVNLYSFCFNIGDGVSWKGSAVILLMIILIGTPIALVVGLPIFIFLKSLTFSYYYSFPFIYVLLTVLGMRLLVWKEALPLQAYVVFLFCGLAHSAITILVDIYLTHKFA